MVVAQPDAAGIINDDFVYLHDLMPTILESAGIPIPRGLDGVSLVPAINGRPQDGQASLRDDVFCLIDAHFFTVNQRMVRTRTHQFTFNPGEFGELYDLVKDPYQLDNVYEEPEYGAVRDDLMDRMDRHMRNACDPTHTWFKRIRGVY